MLKHFIAFYAIFICAFTIYVYRVRENEEHDRNVLILFLAGMFTLILTALLLGFKPELKFLGMKIKNLQSTEAEIEPYKKSYNSSYFEGYLLKGGMWVDQAGTIRRNLKDVRVEIWRTKIVMADGNEITQIFFLEGIYAGMWGYTHEVFLLPDDD